MALLPGLPQALDRRYLLTGILVGGGGVSLGLIGGMLLRGRDILLDLSSLRTLIVGATLLSVVLISSILTSRAPRPEHPRGRTAYVTLALSAVLLAATPSLMAAWLVVPQLHLVEETFVDVPAVRPHPLEPSPETSDGSSTASTLTSDRLTGETLTDPPALETPVPALSVIPGRVNILLLGGDAGPGRSGLRTDSINLLSIEPGTGDIAIVGIPRNLANAPVPPGLTERFPHGFDNIINAVYGWGRNNRQAVIDALGPTEDSGATLLTSVVSELTGQPVDAFVLVDMQGFLELVDAIGGVDLYVDKRLPAPGNIPGAKHPVTDLEPGWYRFDGTDALSYARSRKADSDYSRMSRQRCLMASIAAQTSTVDLLTRWPSLSRIISDMVRTNMTPDMFDLVVAFAGVDTSTARSLALTPPTVPSSGWDLGTIRRSVAAFLRTGSTLDPNAAAVTTTTAPQTTDSGAPTAPGDSTPTETTTPASPETTSPAVTPTAPITDLPTPEPGTLLGARCQVRRPG